MKQYIKHTAIITTNNVGAKVLTLAFFAILARILTVDQYGYYRYLLNVSAIFGIVFSGITTALTKFLGESNGSDNSKYYVADSLIFLSISFAACIILSIVFSVEYIALILLSFAMLLENFYMGFARGLLNMNKLAGFRLLQNFLRFSILVVCYYSISNLNFTPSVIIYSLSGLAALIIFELIRPQLQFKINFVKERIRTFLNYSANIMAGNIGGTLLIAVNPIFIAKFDGNDAVGYYSVALALTQLFGFLPEAISLIALPRISALEDRKRAINPILIASIGCIILSIS